MYYLESGMGKEKMRMKVNAMKYKIGMVGLGVMGRNLVLNMADHGFSVVGYDRDPSKVQSLRQESKGRTIFGAENIQEFIGHLQKPHVVMLLIPPGAPVDAAISELMPNL